MEIFSRQSIRAQFFDKNVWANFLTKTSGPSFDSGRIPDAKAYSEQGEFFGLSPLDVQPA